jgi:hypothetical protein
LEQLKRTLLRWKPILSLTPEYWVFMELSHTMGMFVWVAAGVVSKYFRSLCLKCYVPNNASQQWFLEVNSFSVAQGYYSKDQLWQPFRWGNVQHSLNMSSVCWKILRHVWLCKIGLLQMISITVMASRINSGELVLISLLA